MRPWILGMALALLTAAPAVSIPVPDLPRAKPGEHGLDPEPLDQLVRLIREGERYPDLHSLLIVRHGHLVVEEYFAGWNSGRLHTLQSVSKSVTSALIGIAIERGEIDNCWKLGHHGLPVMVATAS